jgi:hypothetical protein
VRLCS